MSSAASALENARAAIVAANAAAEMAAITARAAKIAGAMLRAATKNAVDASEKAKQAVNHAEHVVVSEVSAAAQNHIPEGAAAARSSLGGTERMLQEYFRKRYGLPEDWANISMESLGGHIRHLPAATRRNIIGRRQRAETRSRPLLAKTHKHYTRSRPRFRVPSRFED